MDPKIISEVLSTALDTLPRITMADLYIRCIDLIEHVKPNDFRLNVSKWISDGTIPGYESRKGPTGGIYKISSKTEKINKIQNNIEQEELNNETELVTSDGVFTVQISPTLRIAQSDDRNWAIQKKSGENWISKYYHDELSGALKSVAKHIINGEFKLANSTVQQLNELHLMIKTMEDKLVNKLQETIQNAKNK